ncbi:serine protease [Aeromonas veronii]|uniref:ABC-three component system protein n=1 Tax=Aeromonas veronii TaxID=654 RepID=UPI00226D3437|nr:ABC-three component system protein [Aeromonas veronii]MCX9112656.1 serine protease [Aeromonas veronii]
MTICLYDIAKKHTVRVCNGSGVLIQPNSTQYSYVLTAKHVITDEANSPYSNVEVINNCGVELNVINKYFDEDLDLAILMVHYQEKLDLECYYGELANELRVSIYGYPEKRSVRGDNEPSAYILTLVDKKNNNVLEFKNTSNAFYDDVIGFSGCGFYHFDLEVNRVQLVGIQNKMACRDSPDGHIQGYSLCAVESIINKFSLATLTPPYLSCFIHSEPRLFSDLSLCDESSLDIIKQHIRFILNQHDIYKSERISPENIISEFKGCLLSCDQIETDLHQIQLWVWFLEFLSIYLTICPPNKTALDWETALLSDLFKRFRFVYTHKPTDFRKIFRQYIACTDFSSIDEDAKIILFANGEKPGCIFLDDNLKFIPKNITLGLTEQQIDIASASYELNNAMIHWPKLNDSFLAAKEREISEIDLIRSRQALKTLVWDQYNRVLIDGK